MTIARHAAVFLLFLRVTARRTLSGRYLYHTAEKTQRPPEKTE
jgi:hypothetical protein